MFPPSGGSSGAVQLAQNYYYGMHCEELNSQPFLQNKKPNSLNYPDSYFSPKSVPKMPMRERNREVNFKAQKQPSGEELRTHTVSLSSLSSGDLL